MNLIFIALGGALGALARYGVATHVSTLWNGHWPLGTLLINSAGSMVIGIVFVLLERSLLHPDWRGIVMVGFLGAFTTFSTFSLEAVQLWLNGHAATAVAYAVISTCSCIAAAALGIGIARSIL